MEAESILDLLPQRPPMVMVDGILSCREDRIETFLKAGRDNIFVAGDSFSEAGMMEMIAQSAAARAGWLLRHGTQGPAGPVPVGVIGQIRNFVVRSLPPGGAEIRAEVTVSHDFGSSSVIYGKVYHGNEICAEGEMKIFLNP